MTMTSMNNVNVTANDHHEFRAALPWIDKINPDALAFRAKNGITKTLAMGTKSAGDKTQAQAFISACNFSASQCVKELKKRGIPFKG